MRSPFLCWLAVATVLLGWPLQGSGQEGGERPEPALSSPSADERAEGGAGSADAVSGEDENQEEAGSGGRRAFEWGVDVGYGRGLDISGERAYLGDVRFVGISPRAGGELGRAIGEGRRREGKMALFVELPVLLSTAPREGYALGTTLVGRYAFSGPERIRPFVEVGAGPAYLRFHNELNQADGLSFTLQAGIGFARALGGRWAAIPRLQLHHLSNAGLRKPNPGINNLLFTFGLARSVF